MKRRVAVEMIMDQVVTSNNLFLVGETTALLVLVGVPTLVEDE